MDEATQICASCGKQNPVTARFCFACGTALAAEVKPAETAKQPEATEQEASIPPERSEARVPELAYVQPAPQAAPQGYPSAGYPPAYPQQVYPPSKPPKRHRRLQCCAIGCLAVAVVLLIGLPILHLTLLRPFIEHQIYTQVRKSLEDVGDEKSYYSGPDAETITERRINDDAQDTWSNIPGSSEGHIYLQQDQIKLEVKIYGIPVWAAADVRVNNRGEFVVKSVKMHWLLNVLFSEGRLKREIADYANDMVVYPRELYVLAFQVSDGKLYIAYEPR